MTTSKSNEAGFVGQLKLVLVAGIAVVLVTKVSDCLCTPAASADEGVRTTEVIRGTSFEESADSDAGGDVGAPSGPGPNAPDGGADPDGMVTLKDVSTDPDEPKDEAKLPTDPMMMALPAPEPLPGYKALHMDVLAGFKWEQPPIKNGRPAKEQIPKKVKALHGEKITVQGFMIPFRTKKGRVIEFAIVRDLWGCCFGKTPGMNEWIHITMPKGKTAPYAASLPVIVSGRLQVGEEVEDDLVMSIYRMTADKVDDTVAVR